MTSTRKYFVGTCACCLGPVLAGNEIRFRNPGRTFHVTCVEKFPNDYYVKLERRLAAKKKRQVS